MTTLPTPRRRASWHTSRRLTDWAFRVALPGRHHSLDNSLLALMTARELRP
ncbi:MAG TPA: hypothetical protein VIM08_15140 [Arthrobacter sp.]